MKPTHVDLFSGIGGFALAASWAGFETVTFCEREPFCQKVLAKHWPEVPCFDDVCRFTGDDVRRSGVSKIHLVTGGFPCQPFSHAGEQLGVEDDRHLWPEMLRVIRELNPDWVVGENVDGFVDLALDLVLSDLEAAGYTCWPCVIPACAAGAPHQRNRVWVVAHSNSFRPQRWAKTATGGAWSEKQSSRLPDASVWSSAPSEPPRNTYGISGGVDRLHALGNAIVPQVAYPILAAIYAQLTEVT